MNSGFTVNAEESKVISKWIATLGDVNKAGFNITSNRQSYGSVELGRSVAGGPLCLAGKTFAWGLGTHADSEIVLRCNKPLKSFRVKVGIDHNKASINRLQPLVFSVWTAERCLVKSLELKVNDEPEQLETSLDGATEFTLQVKGMDPMRFGHADWAEAEAVTIDGQIIKIGDPVIGWLPGVLPLSFQYNGMDSEQWFRKWGIIHTQTAGKDCIIHRFVCLDKISGLECCVELQEYTGFPACLWNVYFKNTGKESTPLLEQVQSLNLNWAAEGNIKTLYRARGSFHYDMKSGEGFRDNFMMVPDDLTITKTVVMGGVGGRSSVDWMPYFNFADDKGGLIFCIGWTGQWAAVITSDPGHVFFQAGIECIRTKLEPGEKIRLPSILMLYWQGNDALRGHNLLRRFMTECLLPRAADGQVLQAPASNLTWGGMPAAKHLERIKNIERENIPLDYYWIDAGWYGKAGPNADEFSPEWGSQAGDWSINRETYPRGFREISDAVHSSGRKFLLGVEPERAIYGTPVTLDHPEWFLGKKEKGQNLLLNLGNPAARQWCIELISGLITEQGIDCYRQDFNINPLDFWRANDAQDRNGITEIRYVEGLYAFLDELRRRHPNLLIDNCASGGRRLDFEMMRRSIPLWGSDMQCFPNYQTERNLQQVYGLSCWLPQFGFGTQDHPSDTYHFRSTMAAGIAIHLFSYERLPINHQYPYQWLRDRLQEYHRVKKFYSGDFYPLMDQSSSFKDWTAYQFHRPDINAGMLLVFRKKESPVEKVRFNLRGLDPSASYELEDADSKVVITISGRDLMEKGLPVEIEPRRGSRLFFLQAVDHS